jgi:membrane fusion protein, multidrug efflux system
MRQGDEGDDVRQLQRNLRALGHDPDGDMEVDGEFGWATRRAVQRWQEALGVDETGRVELGEVVFLPTARRMGAASVPVGGSVRPGAAVATTTGTARTVTIDLDARRRDLVEEGARERVTLPDGRTVAAVVSEVGAVATGGEEGAAPTVEVTLTIPDARRVTALDQAPVDVEIASDTRTGVLTVPVTALLALAGGGFGLEVVADDGSTSVVAVEVGASAEGRVEVRGDGVREGVRVVVAA